MLASAVILWMDESAEVKQQPNKDGGGKGQMAAWKAGKDAFHQRGFLKHSPGTSDYEILRLHRQNFKRI